MSDRNRYRHGVRPRAKPVQVVVSLLLNFFVFLTTCIRFFGKPFSSKKKKARQTPCFYFFGVTGFEPAASTSRTSRSTKLSHTPIYTTLVLYQKSPHVSRGAVIFSRTFLPVSASASAASLCLNVNCNVKFVQKTVTF